MWYEDPKERHDMRSNKPITVTLGPQLASLEARLKSGEYASASEVLRSALRALDRQDAALEDYLRAKVQASVRDPRPSVPAADVFKRLRARHARNTKAAKRGA
jgi:antitoxin ParD1/3/4